MAALDDAKTYIDAAFGPTYRAWMSLPADDQSRTLVSSTRYLNRLPWQGEPTHVLDGNSTTLAWPRTGVVVDGVPVDSTTIPQDVTEASFELAVLIVADPSLPGKLDQGSNIQSANAGGGTGVTFFSSTSARMGTATVLPVLVLQLVGKYLAVPVANEGGEAGVGKCESAWNSRRQFTLVRAEE